MRLAVVSTAVPPAASGQARVLGQILAEGAVPPPLWLSDQPPPGDGPAFGRRVTLGPARSFLVHRILATGRGARANAVAGLAATVLARARRIAREARAHGAEAILGCSGSPFDLPSAWLAAERLRLPFGAWLFDDPVLQWPPDGVPPYRAAARGWERLWSRRCAPIAPNEAMAADFAARNPRARPAAIVRNPAADAAYGAANAGWPRAGEAARILYTGSVYAAQADAVRNLVAALARLAPAFQLVLRTPQSAEALAGQGIAGPSVTVLPALPHAEALAEQQRADILFLPLAFDAPIPEVIRSSAPAKAAEYLASGRPVLVHAPAGGYVGRLFGGGAGLVVDRPDPAALAAALLRLRDEPGLRGAILAEAARRAPEFRVAAARAALLKALS